MGFFHHENGHFIRENAKKRIFLQGTVSVASTLKCLFWDFLELCDNYRQISVELPNDKNIQQKNWENFEIMKKSQNYRQISVISAKSDYFQLDSAVVKI